MSQAHATLATVQPRVITTRALLAKSGRSARAHAGGERLFDDVAVQHRLTSRVLSAPGVPINSATAPRSAGVYGLRYHGPHPAYRDLDWHQFLYIGRGAFLPERISSHVASLSEVEDLEADDFSVVWVALDSLVHAEAAESLLIGAFDPIWCRKGWRGFGSRPQGSGRAPQRPTDWDRRHPGRLSRNRG